MPDSAFHRSVLLTLSACSALAAQTSQTVSPLDRATLEGSSFTHLPIGRASARLQTLHADIPGGTVLSGHGYRRDATQVRGLVDGFTCELQVTLSIAPNQPMQASPTFANNVGTNPVVVLPRQFITFPATNRPAVDPATTFELAIPYQVPFTMPAGGGVLCVDIEVFGNVGTAGSNRNLSIYLDSHEHYTDGRSEQPGYRFGSGCAAPGTTTTAYATMSLWELGTHLQFDVALRNGVADSNPNLVRAWLALGTAPGSSPWPTLPQCTLWSSTDVWFALPGTPNAQGDYDGSLGTVPLLPPWLRLWCQAGSAHLTSGALAFGDGTTLVTPPPGLLPIPCSRIANSNDHAATTGAVSYAVPVMAFF